MKRIHVIALTGVFAVLPLRSELAKFKSFSFTNVAMAQTQVSKLNLIQVLRNDSLMTELRVAYGNSQDPKVPALIIRRDSMKESLFTDAVRKAYTEIASNPNVKFGNAFYDILRPYVIVREKVKEKKGAPSAPVEEEPIRIPVPAKKPARTAAFTLETLRTRGVEAFVNESLGIKRLPIPSPNVRRDNRTETILAIFTELYDSQTVANQPLYEHLMTTFRRDDPRAFALVHAYMYDESKWDPKKGFSKGMTDAQFGALVTFFQSYLNAQKTGKVDEATLRVFADAYLKDKGIKAQEPKAPPTQTKPPSSVVRTATPAEKKQAPPIQNQTDVIF